MSGEGLHVLLVPSWYPTAENPLVGHFFQEQARALVGLGARVGVVYPEWRSWLTASLGAWRRHHFQVTRELDEGVWVYRLHGWNLAPGFPRLRARLWSEAVCRLVARYIREQGRPDVLHAHALLWGGVAARRAAARHGIPFVVTEHASQVLTGAVPQWARMQVEAVLRDAERVIAVSRALARELERLAPERPVDVIPNMVDDGRFTLPPGGRPASPVRFLTVAHLTPIKGIDVLLRAFAQVYRGTAVELHVGGDGPQRTELERLAEELGVAGQVRFLGALPREAVREAMWQAHAFVLPSHAETFGVVLIEAMATGLPVIATRCGGPEDIVDERWGFLVKPGDVAALAAALREMGRRVPFSPAEEKALREAAIRRFGQWAVGMRLMDVYAACKARPKRETGERNGTA
ncbi:MAG TPA: glycosyltransferase [Calditerricola sp.]